MNKNEIITIIVGLNAIIPMALSTTQKAAEQGAVGLCIGASIFGFVIFNHMLNN